MAIDFKSLKKNSKTNFEKLTKEVESLKKGSFQKDERLWDVTVGKDGNGLAIIRFMDKIATEDVPFVRMFTHNFRGPKGAWYIENCLTSLGQVADPACEENNKLWETGIESQQTIVRIRKRKQVYTSNILVIQDKANPENEGKHFLYNYGVKIWDKLQAAMHPDEGTGEESFNPFDFWSGANFVLKVKMIAGGKDGKKFRNYDDSKFLKVEPLFKGDDNKIEVLWHNLYALKEIVAPDKFKTYDALRARLVRVLGESVTSQKLSDFQTPQDENAENPSFEPREDPEDSENLEYFQKLAEED